MSELKKKTIDIEGFYVENKKVEQGCFYMIKVTSDVTGDKDKFLIEKEVVTGREILMISGHNPPKNFILKMLGKNKRTIDLDDEVDLTQPGIEKFIVYPASCTEGKPSARRDFPLLPADQVYLDESGIVWEALTEGRMNWVIIRDFQLPNGLSEQVMDIAVKVPQQYPRVQLDMVFFPKKVMKGNGQELSRQTPISINGEGWFQWSRHRDNAISPWRPGIDNLETHLDLMYNCLKKEVV